MGSESTTQSSQFTGRAVNFTNASPRFSFEHGSAALKGVGLIRGWEDLGNSFQFSNYRIASITAFAGVIFLPNYPPHAQLAQ